MTIIISDSWDAFAQGQGSNDPIKKRFLPIGKAVHDLIIETLKENEMSFDVSYGDGTFSLAVPKDVAKSRKRICARFGLLNMRKDRCYLENLYKNAEDELPKQAFLRKKNDPTEYVYRFESMEDYLKVKDSIKKGIITSYNILAKSEEIANIREENMASSESYDSVVTINLPPEQYAALRYNMGINAIKKGQHEKAIKALITLIDHDMVGKKSRLQLAVAYNEVNEQEKAIAILAPMVKMFNISSPAFMSMHIPTELKNDILQEALYISGRIKFETGIEKTDDTLFGEGIQELLCSYDLNSKTKIAATVREYVDKLREVPQLNAIFNASSIDFNLDDWSIEDRFNSSEEQAQEFGKNIETDEEGNISQERSRDMSKQERAEMYRDFLAEEGYTPNIDSDGDITFEVEDCSYFIEIDEKDEDFFRMVFPSFWSIENEEEREKVTHAALYATARTKVTKVYPVRDDTWAAIEMFCSPPEMFKTVFRRSLNALQAGVQNFREKMQE